MNKHLVTFMVVLALLLPLTVGAAPPMVQVVAPWEISSKDPSRAGFVYGRLEVAETLVNVDLNGTHIPGLAATWGTSDDGRTWRFTLRPGVRFHDGTLMTAETVLNSLLIAQQKPGVLNRAPVERIEADNEGIVLTLSEPFSPILSFLTHYSTMILAPAAYDESGNVVEVIGTGPYRITLLQPPQKMEVAAFTEYWGPQPKIKRAGYLAAGRGETRALLAESGEAHIIFTIDPASVQRLARRDHLEIRTVPLPRIVSLKLNCAHPGLEDVQVRQALSLALDRAGIAQAILRQPDLVANQYFPPSMQAWHLSDSAPLRYDIEQAGQLMREAGWQVNKSGKLERDGQPLQVEIVTYPDRPELPLIAAAVQDQWRSLGVEASIAISNSSIIPARHQDNSLEIGLISRLLALVPDPLGILVQDFAPGGGDWGAMNWNNEQLSAVLAELIVAGETDTAEALKRQVSEILHNEMPIIPISWYQQTVAVSHQVTNVIIDPFERVYNISAMEWNEQ